MAEIETTPVKDQESQHPIADAWRQTLREIVKAFVEGDFALTRGIASVSPVAPPPLPISVRIKTTSKLL
jgi:hypothetical protein